MGEKTAAKLVTTYGDLDGIFDHIDEQTPKLRQNLTENEFQARTNAELKGSLKTSNERYAKVAEEARKLAAAMTSTNKQGSWGELQLSRVAELTGMLEHVDFETQNSTAGEQGNLRPDMVISLPGGRKIVVDARSV